MHFSRRSFGGLSLEPSCGVSYEDAGDGDGLLPSREDGGEMMLLRDTHQCRTCYLLGMTIRHHGHAARGDHGILARFSRPIHRRWTA